MSVRLSLFTVLLLAVVSLDGQETIHHASISGNVTDPSGAAVSGASVEARQIETNLVSTTITDSEGRFRFPYLRVGNYELKVTQKGFAAGRRRVALAIGAAFQIPFSLEVASARNTVEVTVEPPMVETARTQIAGTVRQAELRNVPLNGRSYLDLALLVPGVSPTNTGSTQLFPETSAVPGQGISISSQRNFSNSFILDGLSANDDAAGLSGTLYGLDSIEELQVVTSGGQAEFGRALGGYVNMVSRSGGNTLHGGIYGFLRNRRMNAPNPLTGTKAPMTQSQYGASLGGPILKDRTFYFANFEQRRLNQSGLITISQSNVGAINATLDAANYTGPRIAAGFYPNPVDSTSFLARLDHRISASDHFNLRYSLYDVESRNSRFAGGIGAVSAGAGLTNRDQTIAFSNIITVSPRTVNETRAQFTHSDLKAPVNDAVGPAVTISGVASFGAASGSPTARLDRLYEVVNNLSHQAGAHALRVGADVLYNDLTITYPRSTRGSYSFSSLANFQAGRYNTFTQTFGNPVIPQGNANIGLYAQDEWHVTPKFTVNAGLRYDLQFLDTIDTDRNNVAPRLGFAWSPLSNQRTVVRASFGLFYDRVPLRALANALLSSRNTVNPDLIQQQSTTLSFGQAGAPVFPNILTAVPSGVLISFTTMDKQMENAHSEQASLEIEQQLGQRSTVSVSYQHVRGVHLIISLNQNVPACSAEVDPVNLCRPDPPYQNNSQYSPKASSQYDGMSVSFLQRPGRWGDLRLSYTFSKAFADVGEFFFSSPANVFDPRQDWGRSDDDQRHRVVVNANVRTSTVQARNIWQRLSHGFQLGGMLQYYSSLPFNIVSGVNTVQQTAGRPCPGVSAAGCTIPNMIARNTGRGFDYFTLSSRLSRTFAFGERWRLEAIAEAFNLLNRRNDMIPRSTFGAGVFPASPREDFGTPTAVGDPRQIQLALRVSF